MRESTGCAAAAPGATHEGVQGEVGPARGAEEEGEGLAAVDEAPALLGPTPIMSASREYHMFRHGSAHRSLDCWQS
eukprot:2537797-Alexandrium_andersonii.AAC.1